MNEEVNAMDLATELTISGQKVYTEEIMPFLNKLLQDPNYNSIGIMMALCDGVIEIGLELIRNKVFNEEGMAILLKECMVPVMLEAAKEIGEGKVLDTTTFDACGECDDCGSTHGCHE